MPRKAYARKSGGEAFLKAWFTGTVEDLDEAFRREASRMYGEMERWMKDQEKYDPMGMLWHYEETLFPLIRKARTYRGAIYERNKLIEKLKFEIIQAQHAEDMEKAEDLRSQWNKLEAEQIGYCWKIKKIHIFVKHKVILDLTEEDFNPFEEYEYDPEKS